MPNDIDVLILGAGMAGLTAARALAERGIRVCILEARPRVGGRILSQQVEGGGIVELGAEFVHGRAPELWALIDEAGATTVERHGSMLREQSPGSLVADDPQDNAMFEPLEQLEHFTGEDQTFADWLAASNVPADLRPALTAYVEGFNAADAHRISVRSLGIQQRAEDATEADRSWHLPGGYAQLPDYLATRVKDLGGTILLDCEVRSIRWTPGSVLVETTRGEFSAPQCILTFPLGVLHNVNRPNGIAITPEPAAIPHARRLAMGHASRFTMIFRSQYWQLTQLIDPQTLRTLSFLFTPNHIPPVWWTSHPDPHALPALTGWAGGPRASALEGKTPAELGSDACATLASIFALDQHLVRSALVATYSHDWAADPFALGAYSYVPTGAVDASAAMAQPQANTLFFAGEHTDITGNWGTVHAAIRSGLRVATQILEEPPSYLSSYCKKFVSQEGGTPCPPYLAPPSPMATSPVDVRSSANRSPFSFSPPSTPAPRAPGSHPRFDYRLTQRIGFRIGLEDAIVRYRTNKVDDPGTGAPPFYSWLSKDQFINRGNFVLLLGPVFNF